MSDNEKFYGDEDESDTVSGTGADSGLHEQDSDDTEGHMHPDEFPQGPVRRSDDSVQGNLPQS